MDELVRNLTLEHLSLIIIFVLGLFVGIRKLKKEIKDAIAESLKDEFKEVNEKLDALQKSLTKVDTQTCKNFLVRYLADVERGEHIYNDEQKRFWEEYDHYILELKENSYIKEWVEQLKKEGKLKRETKEE